MDTREVKELLVQAVSEMKFVKGAAQTGDIQAPLVPGQSDVDLFVLCDVIPEEEERKEVYNQHSDKYTNCYMNVSNGGIWGHGDILVVNEIDVMFMFFTLEEMHTYVDNVLEGNYLDKQGDFYPTGRLASIESIHILYEEEKVWSLLKEKVKRYPSDLFEKLFTYHYERILSEEDLGRVLLRKEVLFYHQVLESGMEHFLQALFAKNEVYFPSRKRTKQYIDGFLKKPENCYERLMNVIKLSVMAESLEDSVKQFRELVEELK